MSKSKIALIAALAGMSIASPAFAQSQDRYGSVLPYHYEGDNRHALCAGGDPHPC